MDVDYNNSPRFPFLREMNVNASPERMQIESPLIGRGHYSTYQQLHNPYYGRYNFADNLENVDPRLFCYLTSRDGYHTPPGAGMFHPALASWSSSSDGSSSRGTGEKKSLSSGSSSVFGGTPANVKDEVLVMDGILGPSEKVRSSSGGSSGSSSRKITRKKDCLSWEATGTCKYGPKCLYFHKGQEQSLFLTPPRPPQVDGAGGSSMRTPQSASSVVESAVAIPKTTLQPASSTMAFPPLVTNTAFSSVSPGPMWVKPQSAPSITTSSATASVSSPSITTSSAIASVSSPSTPATPLTVNQTTAPTKTPDAVASQTALSSTTKETESVPGASEVTAEKVLTGGRPVDRKTNADWCPLDDGIDVSQPPSMIKNPTSREEVQSHIHGALHGGKGEKKKKRLPVFENICPQ